MSGVRRPVVMGLSPGAGSSTLTAALHATDGGLLSPGTVGEADILLCRADLPSLRHATALACAPAGPQPVLVLATPHGGPSTAPPVQIGRFGAFVALPYVGRWDGAPCVRREAAAALAFPLEDLPPGVATYAAALRRLVGVLSSSGLLGRSTPPLVSRPATGPLRRGLQPLARPVTAGPARRPSRREPRPELDDEAIETEPVPASAVPAR